MVSGLLARSAGSNPNTTPVSSVIASVNDKMRRSGVGATSNGAPSTGSSASSPRVRPIDSTTPTAPPANDSTRLSASSCRISCRRDAPIDSRTAISRWRMNARAMSRLATFAQAIRRTRPTMHIRTISGVEKSLRRPEYPISARSIRSCPCMKRSRVNCDQFFAPSSVISWARSCRNSPCIGARADSIVVPA